MALSNGLWVALATFICFYPHSTAAASCGIVGSLRHPQLIEHHQLPAADMLGLVLGCQKACMDSPEMCMGFAVSRSDKTCNTFSKTMERQGITISQQQDKLHYDRSCFDDLATLSSTKVTQNVTNLNDPYTCVPSPDRLVYNPSFEEGIWIGYAHGWHFRSTSEESKAQRSATGAAFEGNTNLVVGATGSATSAISQTLCLIPMLKYRLSAYIGHISYTNIFGQQEFYYYAPTLSVYLDRDLIFRNSVCGEDPDVQPTECQPNDGSYYPISLVIEPQRATPKLTFEFEFDAPEGKRSYKALLDHVQLQSVEPPL